MIIKNWFKNYQNAVNNACLTNDVSVSNTVVYWQNRFFSSTMQIVLPLSLITMIPGVIFSFLNGFYIVGALDILSFALILIIALAGGINLFIRKLTFVLCIQFIGTFLLYFIGFKGPGFLFLYAACIFGVLILPSKYAYWWSYVNTIIVVFFAFAVYFNWLPETDMATITVAEWIAIAVNLIFLSFLTSALLPKLFVGLSQSFDEQEKLQQNLKQALTQLELKNEDLEQFAYVASHDLNEPLRTINSFLGLLEKKYQKIFDDKGKQYIHFATDGAMRMRFILRDLLEYSRAGRSIENPTTFNVSEIIEEIKELFQLKINETKTQIVTKHLPVVTGHKHQFLQVLQNLIDNAIKYQNPKIQPVITINATNNKHFYTFYVADNGIGINSAYFDKIFVIFQRLHARNEYSGTGIGLAIVKKIVERWGGSINVKSEPNIGTTFCFTFPKNF